MEKILITKKDAANALSVSVDTIDRLSEAGKLKKLHIGSRVYFSIEDILNFSDYLKRVGTVFTWKETN